MDATTWGLALLGIGLIITVVAATRVGPVSTALFAVGLSAMLAGTMLLDMVRRGQPMTVPERELSPRVCREWVVRRTTIE